MNNVLAARRLTFAALRVWIFGLIGWRRSALAFAAGGVSVLAFAPFFLWPILFITLPVLVWMIDGAKSPRAAAIAGWWFGFGYFVFGLFWIGEAFLVEADKFAWMLPFAVTLLPAGLALFWAAAAGLSRLIWPKGFARVLVLAIGISVAEWLRGNILTGLPWNILGYALTYPDALMQSAGVIGIYGLTLVAAVIFAGPVVLLADAADGSYRARLAPAVALASGPLLVMLAYGAWRLSIPVSSVDGVKIRIVQPNILQTEKWRPEQQRRIFDEHLTLSSTNAQGQRDDLQGVTHLIWPEAAMPFLPLEQPKALAAIADLLPAGTSLITGALRRATTRAPGEASNALTVAAYNSILVFDEAGALSASYDKIHLVPFGEYIPMENLLKAFGLGALTFGRSPFTPGAEPRQMLNVAGLPPVLGLVCYEALFPRELAQAAGQAGAIVNVTNDGWFGNTTGPRQHFHQARVRAVEQGLPMLRAANNGISGVIDGYGRVLGSAGMNVAAVIDSPLPQAAPRPPIARLGKSLFAAMLAACAALVFGLNRKDGD